MKYKNIFLILSFFTLVFSVSAQPTSGDVYDNPGSYSVDVSNLDQITVEIWGAGGGDSYSVAPGGGSGGAAAENVQIDVSNYNTAYFYVGGKGEDGSQVSGGGNGGFNGGGDGGDCIEDNLNSDEYCGGGGGGATDIRLGGDTASDRVIVLGGGGGGGGSRDGGHAGTPSIPSEDAPESSDCGGSFGDGGTSSSGFDDVQGGNGEGGAGGGGAGFYGGYGGCQDQFDGYNTAYGGGGGFSQTMGSEVESVNWVDNTYYTTDGKVEVLSTTEGNVAPSAPSNPDPSNGATEISTNPTLSVDVSDPDGDSMDVTFYDASDDSQIGSTQTSISDGGTASVTWNSLNDGTNYDWYAIADDGSETTQSSTFSFTTNYAPDSPTLVNPSDGDTRLNTDVTLQVDVSDSDGNSMDVSFYDASDDSLLGTDTNVASGGRAEYSWTGLDYGTNYNWYAVADDGSVTTQSSTWGFKTTHLEEITNNDAHTGSFWIENDAIRWVSSGLELILRNVNLVDNSSPGPVGSVWIEDTSIHWINENSEERSYEGPVIDASTAAPNGYTWIENDLIHYVDQSGDERVINGE